MPQIANSIALVAAVATLFGCAWLLLREAGRRRQGLESLRRAKDELLKIVFQNLLVNGAHAMQGQGTIRISVKAFDSLCHIAFSDAGPGIPPAILDKIFTPFFTTKNRGSGLGLPTARRLIEAQRGSISIDCPPAGGTTVSIQFPAQGA